MPTYAGDVPANKTIAENQIVRVHSTGTTFEAKDLFYRVFSFVYTSPSNAGACVMRCYYAMEFVAIYGTTDSGSMDLQVNKRSSPDTSGTNVLSSAMSVGTGGSYISTFDSGSVSADTWLYVDLSNKSGTVNYISITLILKIT